MTKYPCGICKKGVRSTAVCCVKCSIWFHKKCLLMTDLEFKNICNDKNNYWKCNNCKLLVDETDIEKSLLISNIDEYVSDPEFDLNTKILELHDFSNQLTFERDKAETSLRLLELEAESNLNKLQFELNEYKAKNVDLTNKLKNKDEEISLLKVNMSKQYEIIEQLETNIVKTKNEFKRQNEILEAEKSLHNKQLNDDLILRNELKIKELEIHNLTEEINSLKSNSCNSLITYHTKYKNDSFRTLSLRLQTDLLFSEDNLNKAKSENESLKKELFSLQNKILLLQTEIDSINKAQLVMDHRNEFAMQDYNKTCNRPSDKWCTWFKLSDTDIELLIDTSLQIPSSVSVVNTAVSHILRKEEDFVLVSKMCDDMGLKAKQYIFAIVNDREDESRPGGEHWSLLLLCKSSGVFYHFDSVSELNFVPAMKTATSLSRYFGKGDFPDVVKVNCRQQSGVNECGVYVLHNLETALSLIANDLSIVNSELYLQNFDVDLYYRLIRENLSTRFEISCSPGFADHLPCQPRNGPLKPVLSVKSKPTMFLIGDSHVRGMADLLTPLFPHYFVTSIFYPGAPMGFIINELEKKKFSKDDLVILLGGTNNTHYGYFKGVLSHLEKVILSCKATIILTELPYLYKQHRHKNQEIKSCNSLLYSVSVKCNLKFLIFNHFLKFKVHFCKDGVHLNGEGKSMVCKKINSWLTVSFGPEMCFSQLQNEGFGNKTITNSQLKLDLFNSALLSDHCSSSENRLGESITTTDSPVIINAHNISSPFLDSH